MNPSLVPDMIAGIADGLTLRCPTTLRQLSLKLNEPAPGIETRWVTLPGECKLEPGHEGGCKIVWRT